MKLVTISNITIASIIIAIISIACIKAKNWIKPTVSPTATVAVLPKGVIGQTVVEDNKVTVVTKKEGTGKYLATTVVKETKKYVNEDAKVTHKIKEDGTIEVIVSKLGLCFTPELMFAKDINHFREGVGIKWCYWNRFSSSIGVQMYDLNLKNVKPYLSIDYALPYLKHTRVGVYYNFDTVGIKFSLSF